MATKRKRTEALEQGKTLIFLNEMNSENTKLQIANVQLVTGQLRNVDCELFTCYQFKFYKVEYDILPIFASFRIHIIMHT